MPSKIIFERFLWLHSQVKAEKYPNARVLAEKFELTRKTAQRDIEFIRGPVECPAGVCADQIQAVGPDGSLCLTFPVADLREVKREVLRFGALVEVPAPEQLRIEVKKEREKIYRC